jgi:hypothetical protein
MKDLFQTPELIPDNVANIIDRYWSEYGEDMHYEDTENMLNEVEKEGYTFEYDLSNMPFALRPLNVPFNEVEGY